MLSIVLGIVVAFGIALILAKIGFSHLAGYALAVDLVLTFILSVWFSGTISGLITGTIAGITISLMLYGYTKFIGYDRYSFKDSRWEHTKGVFERWGETFHKWFYKTQYNLGLI